MFGAICCSFLVSWVQRWCVPNTLWIMGRVWSVKPDPRHRMININPLPSAHTNLSSLLHTHTSLYLSFFEVGTERWWMIFRASVEPVWSPQARMVHESHGLKSPCLPSTIGLSAITGWKCFLLFYEWMRWLAVSLKAADLWPTRRTLLQINPTSLGPVLLKNACSTGLGSNNEY